jgi:hypothetical protein
MTSASSAGRSWQKVSRELVRGDPHVPVGVGRDVGRRRGRHLLGDRPQPLSGIRRERGDVDETSDVGKVTGFGDHRPAVGMSDQQDRSVDLLDHLLGTAGVVGQRGERVLHRVQGPVAATIQFDDHLAPVGGTAPKTVYENNSRLTHENTPSG